MPVHCTGIVVAGLPASGNPLAFCGGVSRNRATGIAEVTNGRGSAKVWRPCTPAIAAGLTDHVWNLKEVLLFRVLPWPQPQTG
jgi:hypothetical protein